MEEYTGIGGCRRRYQICIGGILDPRWSVWFDGIAIVHDAGDTTLLTGLIDQAALYGIIARLRDLSLTLLSVSCDS